jgi:hypothetical protein
MNLNKDSEKRFPEKDFQEMIFKKDFIKDPGLRTE